MKTLCVCLTLLTLSVSTICMAQTLTPENWLEGIKQAKAGDVLTLEAGQYLTDQQILIKKNITLIGAGTDKTAIKSQARAAIVIKEGGISLKNLSISGQKFGVDIQTPAIGPCRFYNVRFCNSQNGIGVAGTDVRFEKCLFEGNAILGTYVYGGKLEKEPRALMEIVFDECEWRNNAIGADAKVTHHAGAIKIIPNCAGVKILNSKIIDAKGIWVDGCHGGHEFRNNYVETEDNALHVELSGHNDNRAIVITDNVFISKKKHGAYISCSSNVTLTHNIVVGPRGISMAGMPRANNYVSGVEFETMHDNFISRNVVYTKLGEIHIQSEADGQQKAKKKGDAVPSPLIYDNEVQGNIVKPLDEYGESEFPADYGPRPQP